MKKRFALILFVLFVVSCSSDSTSSSETSTDSILLKRAIQTRTDISGSEPVITNYTYNGNKLVRWDNNHDFLTKFFYTGDLISRVESYFQAENEPIVFRYFYNNSGQLAIFTRTDQVVDQGFKLLYTYNNNGTVSVREFSGNATTQTEEGQTSVYFLTNSGEIDHIETQEVSGTVIVKSYTYDAKNNPLKNVLGFDKLFFADTGFRHNVTSIITANDQGYDVASTFTYNADDFPTAATQMVSDGSGSTTAAIEYFYE